MGFLQEDAILEEPRLRSGAPRTVSANVMTAGPAGRVAAILSLLRSAVDELVVAVDDRAGADVVAAVAAIADRVVRYPYAEPVDRPLAWLHAMCAGDWVLTVDDDEIPSAALLAGLPDLIAADDVSHYMLPRRWLYPDAARCLDQDPWKHDWLLRLVRNDPRLLVFPFELHEPIAAIGPCRYAELPLYHADCVVNTTAARERKARKYDRLRPGMRGAAGSFNEDFYLPERRRRLRTAPLPGEDRAIVASVLAASGPPEGTDTDPGPVPAVTREEIDRLWSGRPYGPASYRAVIEPLADPRPMRVGEHRHVPVRVTNLGDRTWPWGPLGRPEIRLSYHWFDESDDRVAVFEGLRTPLPGPLPPRESTVALLDVVAPGSPGVYRLDLDMVHEGERWFGCEAHTRYAVIAPRRRR